MFIIHTAQFKTLSGDVTWNCVYKMCVYDQCGLSLCIVVIVSTKYIYLNKWLECVVLWGLNDEIMSEDNIRKGSRLYGQKTV